MQGKTSTVKINVGGRTFESTSSTFGRSEFLRTALANFVPARPPDDLLFVDRCPEGFASVLALLRNPAHEFPEDHLSELAFYLVDVVPIHVRPGGESKRNAIRFLEGQIFTALVVQQKWMEQVHHRLDGLANKLGAFSRTCRCCKVLVPPDQKRCPAHARRCSHIDVDMLDPNHPNGHKCSNYVPQEVPFCDRHLNPCLWNRELAVDYFCPERIPKGHAYCPPHQRLFEAQEQNLCWTDQAFLHVRPGGKGSGEWTRASKVAAGDTVLVPLGEYVVVLRAICRLEEKSRSVCLFQNVLLTRGHPVRCPSLGWVRADETGPAFSLDAATPVRFCNLVLEHTHEVVFRTGAVAATLGRFPRPWRRWTLLHETTPPNPRNSSEK